MRVFDPDVAGVIVMRLLCDGSTALASFNRADQPQTIAVKWNWMGLRKVGQARDLWKHADVPVSGDGYYASVPAHRSC